MILPQLGEGFDWIESAAGLAIVCRPLEPFANHLFTTRSWPLGSAVVGDAERWNDVARAIDVKPERLLRVGQVHGANLVVQRARQPMVGATDADIIVCDDPEVALAVQAADCVPLLVADRRAMAFAAAHAGWRGTAVRVAQVTVRALAREFGSRPADLIVAIGPSIGPCCYEVGGDVRACFETARFSAADLARWFLNEPQPSAVNRSMHGRFHVTRPGHWFFDIRTATADQLIAAGVSHDRIVAAELCTASHPGLFCSYRRDGPRAGRMAAVVRRVKG